MGGYAETKSLALRFERISLNGKLLAVNPKSETRDPNYLESVSLGKSSKGHPRCARLAASSEAEGLRELRVLFGPRESRGLTEFEDKGAERVYGAVGANGDERAEDLPSY